MAGAGAVGNPWRLERIQRPTDRIRILRALAKRNPGFRSRASANGTPPGRRNRVDFGAGGRWWSELVRLTGSILAEIPRRNPSEFATVWAGGCAPRTPRQLASGGRARRTFRIFHLAGANFMVFSPPQKRKSRGRAEGNPPPASGLTKYLRDLKVHMVCTGPGAGARELLWLGPGAGARELLWLGPGAGARELLWLGPGAGAREVLWLGPGLVRSCG